MVEKRTDEAEQDGQFKLPDPADVYAKAGAAFQGAAWLNDSQYQQSDDVLAAARALGEIVARQREEEQHAQFRKEKTAALNDLDALIANAPDEDTRNKLREIRERVDNAKFGDNIPALVANARGDSAKAVSQADGVSDISAMHQELYKNDAKYRAEVDKIHELSKKDTEGFDKKQVELDKLAKEKGYTTSVDKERAEIEAEIKKLENDPLQADKLLELRLERLRIIEQQRKEIEKQARDKGDADTAKAFEDHKPVVDEQRKLQLEHLKKLQDELLKAMERNWKAAGKSQEWMDEQRSIYNQKFDEKRKSFEHAATGYEETVKDINMRLQEEQKPQVEADKNLMSVIAAPIDKGQEKVDAALKEESPPQIPVKLDYKDEAHDPEKAQNTTLPAKPATLNIGL